MISVTPEKINSFLIMDKSGKNPNPAIIVILGRPVFFKPAFNIGL